MKRIFTSIIVLISFSINTYCQNDTLRVLFLGNSYTAVNQLPELTANLSTGTNKILIYDSYTPGGCTLEEHSTNASALDKIRLGNWDYVVLQGSSYHIAFESQHYLIRPHIERLDSMIHDNCPATETIFFMDWAMKDGVYWNSQTYSYGDFQQRIASGTKIMADQQGMIIAPIGWAFKTVIDDRDDIELFHY